MNALRHIIVGAITAVLSAAVEQLTKRREAEQAVKNSGAKNDPPGHPVYDGPTQLFPDEGDKEE